MRVGVIGSGSWATAMVKMLGDNELDKQVYWWVRKPEDVEHIKKYKHNPSYLRSVLVDLPERQISSDARAVIQQSDIVILNTPAAYLKAALQGLTAADFAGKIVVSAIKGIVPVENLIVGVYLEQAFQISLEEVVVVGGPCHAEEVSSELLSYLTVASKTERHAEKVASVLKTRYIKTLVSTDTIGVEYAAVLKNIYALAGGICHSLGFGDNFQAVLVSNAIREIAYCVNELDKRDREINHSAYLGDLLVTAYSQFSRNRTFGAMIGKGYSVRSAQIEMNMVAEGYYASACIQDIIKKHGLDMPICNTVYQILYNSKPPMEEIKKLAEKLT